MSKQSDELFEFNVAIEIPTGRNPRDIAAVFGVTEKDIQLALIKKFKKWATVNEVLPDNLVDALAKEFGKRITWVYTEEEPSALVPAYLEWVDPEFEDFATLREEETAGIAILGVRRVCVPCAAATIFIQSSDDRRLGLVEEFVLEAVTHSQELQSIDAVSELLGLDPLFVERSVRALEVVGAIEVVDGVKLIPTERTDEILQLKELPSNIETSELEAAWNPVEQKAHLSKDALFTDEPNGVVLFAPGEVVPDVNWEDLAVITPILGATHRLVKKKVQITEVQSLPLKWLSLTIALYRDFLNNETLFMLYRDNRRLSKFTEKLKHAHSNQAWNIEAVFEGYFEPFDDSAHPRALALAKSTFSLQRDTPKKAVTHTSVRVIPPRRIRETFLDMLGASRKVSCGVENEREGPRSSLGTLGQHARKICRCGWCQSP